MGRRKVVLAGLLTAAVVGALALAMAAQRKPAAAPAPSSKPAPTATASGAPVLWRLPAFSFSDQNGRPVTDRSLRGHVFVANFFFTTCTSICPLITAKMALLQRRLTDPSLRFVSFSVDPAHDTPEALKRYAAEWRPDETRWSLLATTPPALEKLAAQFFVEIRPIEKDIAHANLFFLVDAEGSVRGIYESNRDDAVERLVEDLGSLVRAPAGVTPASEKALDGRELYASLGCGACHGRAELAPPLEGLLGRHVELEGGGGLDANAAYVRESIVAPDAKLVSGFPLRMPSYASALAPRELDALVDYVAGLAAPIASARPKKPAGPPPSATPAPSAVPVPSPPPAVATDPVCSMSVKVTDKTPRATHAGKSYYFCSDTCRERFVADPPKYVH